MYVQLRTTKIKNFKKKGTKKEVAFGNLFWFKVKQDVLILEFHKVNRNIAVNGTGWANTANFEPFDRLQRKADAIIEVIVSVLDIVVVIDGMALRVHADGVTEGLACGFIAVANQRDEIQPRQHWDFLTHIDGKSRMVIILLLGHLAIQTMLGILLDKIGIKAHQWSAYSKT